jgi:predicted acyltransferase
MYKDIVQRSIILFLLGLFLNIYPMEIPFSTVRLYGILQRIAVCYLVCSFIYLNTTIKTQILIFLGIILAYWLLMTQISVPGFGPNQLTAEGSWVAYFDQLLFSAGHLYSKTYDPEGFLSTFPSIATTLFGLIIGHVLLTNKLTKETKCAYMATLGLISLVLGGLWSVSFPINKNLWTSSYVLWSGGLSLLLFSCCFLLIDVLGYQKWALPFKIFGMNALFAFIFHVLVLKTQVHYSLILANGTSTNMKNWVAESLFSNYSPANSSLFYSLGFLFINFLIVIVLYKRKIFIRI